MPSANARRLCQTVRPARRTKVFPEFDVDVIAAFPALPHPRPPVLIRELEAKAGYPAASLKERIYCTTGKEPMAGVLIYVAVADEEGSLGGLMELAGA